MSGLLAHLWQFLLFIPATICFAVAMRSGLFGAAIAAAVFNVLAIAYFLSIPAGDDFGHIGALFIHGVVTVTTIIGILLGLFASMLLNVIRGRL